MDADDNPQDHPEHLIDKALRGDLNDLEEVELTRHLVACPECSAEVECAQLFRETMAPGENDRALNHVAVEMALARIQDEALDLAAVEGAMGRLEQPRTLRARLTRWLDSARWLRPVMFASLGAAVVLVVAGVLVSRRPQPVATPVLRPLAPIVLEDGSEVAPVDRTSVVLLAEQTPERATVKVQSGGARFRIRHDARRLFRVDVGAFIIEDLGTIFRVDQLSDGSIRVGVTEGRVAVRETRTRAHTEVGAGEERTFLPTPPPDPSGSPPPEPRAQEPRPVAPAVISPGAPRTIARAEGPAELLLAADKARKDRRPQAAVVPLRRLVSHFPNDPRAPSAAFTLGWLLLTDLGRAREAALAFAEAERIAPRGALAEDAAARVAEAWQKAGDSQRAAQAARRYQQTYPGGRYTALMRGLVGED